MRDNELTVDKQLWFEKTRRALSLPFAHDIKGNVGVWKGFVTKNHTNILVLTTRGNRQGQRSIGIHHPADARPWALAGQVKKKGLVLFPGPVLTLARGEVGPADPADFCRGQSEPALLVSTEDTDAD